MSAAAIFACTFHAAAILAINLPGDSPFGDELAAPFRPYIMRAGLWQSWTMFHTIPYFSAVAPKLVATHTDGSLTEHDPVLPGLTPYRPVNRLTAAFLRLTFPNQDSLPHLHAYLRRSCDAIAQESGARPTQVTLRLYERRILPLEEIRKHRQIARHAQDEAPVREPCP